MATQSQTTEAKSGVRSKPKVKPAVVVEQLPDELAGLALVAGGPVAAGGADTIDAQAALLGDRRFQTAQRQALAAQIGRVQGNRHLQRVVASIQGRGKAAPYRLSASRASTGSVGGALMNRDSNAQLASAATQTRHDVVQRDNEREVALGFETQGNKVTVSLEGDFPVGPPIKLKYITAKVFCKFGGKFEVELPDGPEPQPGENPPPTKEAKIGQGAAREVAYKYALRAWDKKKDGLANDSLESIDIVPSLGAKGGSESESGFGIAVVVKFGGCAEASGKLTIVKLTEPKDTGGIPLPFDVQGPSLEGEGKLEIPAAKDVPVDKYKLTGSGIFGLKVVAVPNKGEILLYAMKKLAPRILLRFGLTAFQAARNIMSSGPAMIAFLGAYITIKATLATLEEGAEERRVVREAEAACDGFYTGFMTGLGVPMFDGLPHWHAYGLNQASAALRVQVAKIQSHPLFAWAKFTAAELLTAMRQGIAANPKPFKELAESNQWKIKSLYIKRWRDSLTGFQRFFTKTESAEERIKVGLGFKMHEELPEPIDPPPAPPVEPVPSGG